MSIRTKLLTSYALMILVPIVLTYIFVHLLFHLFVGQMDSIKSHFNMENISVEDFLHEEIIVFANLQSIVLENPDQLLDRKVINPIEEKLVHRKTSLVLLRDGKLVNQPNILNSSMINQLPVYGLQQGEHYKYKQESLYLNEKWLIGLQFAFEFSDHSEGNLFLVIDTDPISRLVNRVLPALAVAFLLAFLIANALLTYWMSRQLIRPLKQLKMAAEQIKEGNLDHSIQIRSKDELGQLGNAFEDMRVRLKESIQEKMKYEENRKQLIANISHDLKTPITAIKGYVDGILDGVADTPQKTEKYMRTIHEKADDMDKLIDELFLYSKLDLNSIPFHWVDTNLDGYVQEVIEGVKLDLEKKGVQLHYIHQEETLMLVKVDYHRLKRVFTNIIDNSVNFMDKDNKEITIRISPFELEEGYAFVEIHDNGLGIAEQDLPHIFDQFYRSDPSRNKHNGGSGLGLAIAKQIIQAHGGDIGVKSELGKGTTIYFTLKSAE
ncbi:signal transduction histidine kinase [Paenibacillus sp. DS2015]|uniref:sensor histidine kinase n=1 Tax=Paenibacillus sp. DS2015 TaxID=3373917 RepID=UPI003D1B3476